MNNVPILAREAQSHIVRWPRSKIQSVHRMPAGKLTTEDAFFFRKPSKSVCIFQSVNTTGYLAYEHVVPANRGQ